MATRSQLWPIGLYTSGQQHMEQHTHIKSGTGMWTRFIVVKEILMRYIEKADVT